MDSSYINQVPMPACVVDENGFITSANALIKNVFPYEDISGSKFFALTGVKREDLLTVDEEAIVFAEARVSGEGELSGNDVIRIALNVDGEIKTAYVKNDRLTYLSEDEAAEDQGRNHQNGIAYHGLSIPTGDLTCMNASRI